MMNLLQLDPRDFWATYVMDTGLSRHELVAGDWWFRYKVTRGHKYLVHIVLRGKFSIKAAGFDMITLNKGEAVIHPIKYYLRLIPGHARLFSDVMTIVL